MLDQAWAAVSGLRLDLRWEEQEKAALQRVMEENRASHHKSLAFIKAKVVKCQRRAEELEAWTEPQKLGPLAEDRPSSDPSPRPAASGCVQFTNLFALSGQLAEFCRGEHGRQFVAERVRCGAPPERSLAGAARGPRQPPGQRPLQAGHTRPGRTRRRSQAGAALAGQGGLRGHPRHGGGRAFVEEMVKG